ncbi:hypothetical protein PGT21_035516 [Puccinia graminis f. sp. tritici]|uniref:Uncharacterized protein n=1 Tax=Puccinia graminis f. sp. tritici TaxID=56615 RepID=A0A5B0PBJ3_PUCGR|nr:hypothetical protein PGT21_035516 [Puccinia graminis f. sp. tritici]
MLPALALKKEERRRTDKDGELGGRELSLFVRTQLGQLALHVLLQLVDRIGERRPGVVYFVLHKLSPHVELSLLTVSITV